MGSATAILLGASLFPQHSYAENPAFATSKNDFRNYLQDEVSGLGIPDSQILDLFESELPASSQVMAISTFLEGVPAQLPIPKDLIVYYVGHGFFSGIRQDYTLAIRNLTENFDALTGLKIADLSDVLKIKARKFRKFVFLDCCFAGEALGMFQSQATEAAMRKTAEAFDSGAARRQNRRPSIGTALYGAADKYSVALSPADLPRTMFTDALLRVLAKGDPLYPERLTLAQLHEATWEHIEESHATPVKPILHAPDQSDGDISVAVALFPNVARMREDLKEAEVSTLPRPIIEANSPRAFLSKWWRVATAAFVFIGLAIFTLGKLQIYIKNDVNQISRDPRTPEYDPLTIEHHNSQPSLAKKDPPKTEVSFKSKYVPDNNDWPILSASGKFVIFNLSYELLVVDVQSLAINKIETLGAILAGTVTEDERSVRLIVAEGENRAHIKIQTYDISSGQKMDSVNWRTVTSSSWADISKDGRTAALGVEDKPGNWETIYAIDFPSGKVTAKLRVEMSAAPYGCISSDGSAVFAQAPLDIRVLYTQTGKSDKVEDTKGTNQVRLKCRLGDSLLTEFYDSAPGDFFKYGGEISAFCPESKRIVFEVMSENSLSITNYEAPKYYSFTSSTKSVKQIELPKAIWGVGFCSERFKKLILVSTDNHIISHTFAALGWQ